MSENLRSGLIGAALMGIIALSTFFAGGGSTDDIADPIGLSPAEKICPVGWKDTSVRDEHQIVLSCERDNWIVFLSPDGTFNYAWPGTGPFITNPREVNGWPATPSSPP